MRGKSRGSGGFPVHLTEYINTELKIQIEWRQPDVGPIDSPLNLSLYNNNIGCNFTVIENQSIKHM